MSNHKLMDKYNPKEFGIGCVTNYINKNRKEYIVC